MDTPVRGYSLDFIQSMISEASGRRSGWINDLELRTVFQPAFCLPHRSVIGFEANLRSVDGHGRAVSPQALFGPVRNFAEASMLDMLCMALHAGNFASAGPRSALLLLNLRSEVLLDAENTAHFLDELFRHYGFGHGKVMIDVPSAALSEGGLDEAVAAYRDVGCLISVDDFGSDNSDLDTLWHINPAVVKIDRELTAKATTDVATAKGLQRAVSLLHEMGTLVLMEGLEQEADVVVAMEADADFGSGFHLGPMHDTIDRYHESPQVLDDLWRKIFDKPPQPTPAEALQRSTLENAALRSSNIRQFRNASSGEIARYRRERRPFLNAIQDIFHRMQGGRSLEDSSEEFLSLPGAIRCYTLDGHGLQVGPLVMAPSPPETTGKDFLSLCRNAQGNYSRRDFYRRAVQEPGVTQVTRRYCSLLGYPHCVTFSIAVRAGARPLVICGDVDWSMHTG